MEYIKGLRGQRNPGPKPLYKVTVKTGSHQNIKLTIKTVKTATKRHKITMKSLKMTINSHKMTTKKRKMIVKTHKTSTDTTPSYFVSSSLVVQ